MKHDKSQALFSRATQLLPGGVNSPVRAFKSVGGEPFFVERADGAYLHDPVALIGSLLRPDLVTETVTEALACDTSSDPYLAGSLYRSEADDRPIASVATAIDGDGMKAELIARLGRAVGAPHS